MKQPCKSILKTLILLTLASTALQSQTFTKVYEIKKSLNGRDPVYVPINQTGISVRLDYFSKNTMNFAYIDVTNSVLELKGFDNSGVFFKEENNLYRFISDNNKGFIIEEYSIKDNMLLNSIEGNIDLYNIFKKYVEDLSNGAYYYFTNIKKTGNKLSMDVEISQGSMEFRKGYTFPAEYNLNTKEFYVTYIKNYPEIPAETFEKSTARNYLDLDKFKYIGISDGLIYSMRNVSYKKGKEVTDCKRAIAIHDKEGNLKNSLMLDALLPGFTAQIQEMSTAAIAPQRTASFCSTKLNSQSVYLITFAKKENSKSTFIIFKKFSLDGKLEWESVKDIGKVNINSIPNFRVSINFLLGNILEFGVDRKELCRTLYNINTQTGKVTFIEDQKERNRWMTYTQTLDINDPKFREDLKTFLKENPDLKSINPDEIFKIKEHDYFVIFKGKSRVYYVYRYN